MSSFLTYCLVVPLLVYSSTRRITFQLVVSPFNSSCNDLVHCSWDLRDLGTTTKQSNMAAVEPVDELKECLRASVEMLLDKLNDRLHEDMDGVDYLCVQLDRIKNLVERASGLYDIPLEIVDILRSAQDSLRSLATGKKESWVFNSTGCRGRPSFHIPQDMLQLYLDDQFSLAKIGQIFGVSSKTIQRRITEYDLKKVDFTNVSDNELGAAHYDSDRCQLRGGLRLENPSQPRFFHAKLKPHHLRTPVNVSSSKIPTHLAGNEHFLLQIPR